MRKAATTIIPIILLGLAVAQFAGCEKYVLPDVSVSADTLWFGAGADSQKVAVTTNVITTAKPDGSGGWISADPSWFEESCTLTVHVQENPGEEPRTGQLPIKSEAIRRNIVVIQEGNPNPPEL